MDIHPNQPLPFEYQLPKDVYHHLIHALCGALPLPIPNTPENLIRRDNAAIARIAAMLPANPDEANLATQYISAQDQSLESMRLARRPGLDDKSIRQYIAEANSMMRQANATRRLLMRLQSERQKREANGKTLDQANWLEHCAMSLMADALGRPLPGPIAQATPDPEPPPDDEEPEPNLATEAEHYAIMYPKRAALIRSLGGLPPKCDFGPPRPELVHVIATGTSPHLCALDSPAKARATAPA